MKHLSVAVAIILAIVVSVTGNAVEERLHEYLKNSYEYIETTITTGMNGDGAYLAGMQTGYQRIGLIGIEHMGHDLGLYLDTTSAHVFGRLWINDLQLVRADWFSAYFQMDLVGSMHVSPTLYTDIKFDPRITVYNSFLKTSVALDHMSVVGSFGMFSPELRFNYGAFNWSNFWSNLELGLGTRLVIDDYYLYQISMRLTDAGLSSNVTLEF